MDRASGYGPEGQGFESLIACQKSHPIRDGFFGILRKGFECVTERPGGAFIDQFLNWSIPLFSASPGFLRRFMLL